MNIISKDTSQCDNVVVKKSTDVTQSEFTDARAERKKNRDGQEDPNAEREASR